MKNCCAFYFGFCFVMEKTNKKILNMICEKGKKPLLFTTNNQESSTYTNECRVQWKFSGWVFSLSKYAYILFIDPNAKQMIYEFNHRFALILQITNIQHTKYQISIRFMYIEMNEHWNIVTTKWYKFNFIFIFSDVFFLLFSFSFLSL